MKAKHLHIIFLFALTGFFNPAFLFAQVVSAGGNFEVDFVKGCADMTVTVTNLSGNSTDQYNFDYANNRGAEGYGFSARTDTTYGDPGIYMIYQVVQATGDDPKFDSVQIEVLPEVTVPEFIIQPCSGHQATLEITDSAFDSYRLVFTENDSTVIHDEVIAAGDPVPSYALGGPDTYNIEVWGMHENGANNCLSTSRSFESIPFTTAAHLEIESVEVTQLDDANGEIRLEFTTGNPAGLYQIEIAENDGSFMHHEFVDGHQTEMIVSGLDTENNYYCFRVTAYDGCDPNNNVSSKEVCSIQLGVEAQNDQNVLTWNTRQSFFKLASINVNGSDLHHETDPNVMEYTHTGIECGEIYCYSVIINLDPFYSSSASVCVKGVSANTPPAIESAIANISDEGVEVSWDAPDGVAVNEYIILRSENHSAFTEQQRIQNNLFVDVVEPNGENTFCYRINYEDLCGNLSASSEPVCPVFLTSTEENGSPELTWSDYTGWEAGVNRYILQKRNEEGALIESIDLGLNNEYREPNDNTDQIIYYTILAELNGAPPVESFSNQVRIIYEAAVYFPNAFTPDGDGRNDVFRVLGNFISDYELRIFNRWGELIFYTSHIDEGWNGEYLNRPAPEGTYIYSAIISDFEGNRFNKTGSVYLLRK